MMHDVILPVVSELSSIQQSGFYRVGSSIACCNIGPISAEYSVYPPDLEKCLQIGCFQNAWYFRAFSDVDMRTYEKWSPLNMDSIEKSDITPEQKMHLVLFLESVKC
jgi:hypothetical protein